MSSDPYARAGYAILAKMLMPDSFLSSKERFLNAFEPYSLDLFQITSLIESFLRTLYDYVYPANVLTPDDAAADNLNTSGSRSMFEVLLNALMKRVNESSGSKTSFFRRNTEEALTRASYYRTLFDKLRSIRGESYPGLEKFVANLDQVPLSEEARKSLIENVASTNADYTDIVALKDASRQQDLLPLGCAVRVASSDSSDRIRWYIHACPYGLPAKDFSYVTTGRGSPSLTELVRPTYNSLVAAFRNSLTLAAKSGKRIAFTFESYLTEEILSLLPPPEDSRVTPKNHLLEKLLTELVFFLEFNQDRGYYLVLLVPQQPLLEYYIDPKAATNSLIEKAKYLKSFAETQVRGKQVFEVKVLRASGSNQCTLFQFPCHECDTVLVGANVNMVYRPPFPDQPLSDVQLLVSSYPAARVNNLQSAFLRIGTEFSLFLQSIARQRDGTAILKKELPPIDINSQALPQIPSREEQGPSRQSIAEETQVLVSRLQDLQKEQEKRFTAPAAEAPGIALPAAPPLAVPVVEVPVSNATVSILEPPLGKEISFQRQIQTIDKVFKLAKRRRPASQNNFPTVLDKQAKFTSNAFNPVELTGITTLDMLALRTTTYDTTTSVNIALANRMPIGSAVAVGKLSPQIEMVVLAAYSTQNVPSRILADQQTTVDNIVQSLDNALFTYVKYNYFVNMDVIKKVAVPFLGGEETGLPEYSQLPRRLVEKADQFWKTFKIETVFVVPRAQRELFEDLRREFHFELVTSDTVFSAPSGTRFVVASANVQLEVLPEQRAYAIEEAKPSVLYNTMVATARRLLTVYNYHVLHFIYGFSVEAIVEAQRTNDPNFVLSSIPVYEVGTYIPIDSLRSLGMLVERVEPETTVPQLSEIQQELARRVEATQQQTAKQELIRRKTEKALAILKGMNRPAKPAPPPTVPEKNFFGNLFSRLLGKQKKE